LQVIIPIAGYGTRLRPHTYSIHKALMNVAGKPVLGHVLDGLRGVDVHEAIFIVGYLGEQIEGFVRGHYDVPSRFVVQEEMLGQAHAIWLAREYVHGPVLIVFADTIFEADLGVTQLDDADGVLYVKEVEDPRRFGVAVVEDGYVRKLIEKPDTMEHKLAVVGLYYVRDGEALMRSIEALVQRGEQTKGEYYLADALQDMIDRGARFRVSQATVWEDCGKPETLLQTNRFLLEHGHAQEPCQVPRDVVIVPPVHVAPTARISRSVVGPHVTIGEGCSLSGVVVRDSIIEDRARINNVVLEQSLIGRGVEIRGQIQRFDVGDSSAILSGSQDPGQPGG